MGEIIYELRKKIQDIKLELEGLGVPAPDMSELITSANLLRSNEHLSKVSEKQSELISAYGQYSMALEDMIEVIFDIQNDLKNLLKAQSDLMSVDNSMESTRFNNKKIVKRRPSKK